MNYFVPEIRERLEREIRGAGGNEIFFVGVLSEDGLVEKIRVLARGNEQSVPAIVDSAAYGEVVIHNHPSGDLRPSEPDIHMASVFGNKGVGFFIVNNDASEIYVVVEPFDERKPEPLDIEKLKGILEPDGDINAVMGSGYEKRDEQLHMMEMVGDAFNRDRISLIEAGTGTGKTMAYLIPSIYWSLQNGERVVVSTNTINLQEQLVNKDIPLLERALGDTHFNYSLVKGMGNYLCLLRVETVAEGVIELFEDDEAPLLNDILTWSQTTEDGSLSDLGFAPSERVWDKVRAESDSCLRVRCPHYSNCFFFKARREMASAELLIANHHLVFSDLSIKGASDESSFGILPAFRRIIFDEAHHVEDAATAHFGMGATKFGVIRLLRRLKRKGKAGETKGLIYYLIGAATKLERYLRKGVVNSVVSSVEEVVSPRVDGLEERVRAAFDELYGFLRSISGDGGNGQGEIKVRVTDEVREAEQWKGLSQSFSELRAGMRDLENELTTLVELLEASISETDVAKVLVEFKGIASKLKFYSEVIGTFFDSWDDGFVRWVEGRMGRGDTVFSGLGLSPLDVSEELKDRLYASSKTVIMTSATLTVDDEFQFLRSRLGLDDEERVQERIIHSPFNYAEQALLAIPDDLPPPTHRDYAGAIAPVVLECVKASAGNALILFTSYGMLKRVYKAIGSELEAAGIATLVQGSKPRGLLLDDFRRVEGSALFATDSFWEGVDVPGENLIHVVITRLPFKVPTEPVLEARVEKMESEGVNSFIEYSVPLAVLKFKQGFGRLIRTRADTGAVTVLDRRIISKSYGRHFISSLPDCAILINSTDNVIKGLREFFGKG